MFSGGREEKGDPPGLSHSCSMGAKPELGREGRERRKKGGIQHLIVLRLSIPQSREPPAQPAGLNLDFDGALLFRHRHAVVVAHEKGGGAGGKYGD